MTIGIALCLLGCCRDAWRPAQAGPAAPTFQAAVVAWRDSLRTWSTFSEESRRDRSRDFMRRFDGVDIAAMCRECAKDYRLGVDLAAFLRARFALLPPGATELAAMFRDVTLGLPCHGTAIQTVSRRRDAFEPEEGDTLAAAMLSLADRAGYDDGVRRQLELASAGLSSADLVLQRIRMRLESDEPTARGNGIAMATESRDPRVADLLAALLDRLRERGEDPPTRLLIAYATKSGPAGYDRIRPLYQRSADAGSRGRILEALCRTTDPRAMQDLLDAYGGTAAGIRDSTSQIQDRAERGFYERLWACARILEPIMVASLRGGDSLSSATALEIADRASRFGPPAEPDGLVRALREYAAKPGQDAGRAQRVEATISRIENAAGARLRTESGDR